jgi:membrane protein YqaA with SNARE-associated domain
LAQSRAGLAGLFAVAVAGHMTGKSVLYWLSRRGGRSLPERFERMLERLRSRMTTHPASASGIVLLSSVVGIPPFYLATLAAGAIRMNFVLYLAAGTIGRIVRLGTVLLGGEALFRYLRGIWNS